MCVRSYNFTWSGGTFDVQFRDGGVFWCPQFPSDAKWSFNGTMLEIDWGKFGQYVLNVEGEQLKGGVRGNPSDWRIATFKRAFTDAEKILSGSAWMIHFENGTPFRVEFRADGHFHCASYPGHFSYKLVEPNLVYVEWGKYGSYDFELDVAGKQMKGSLRGNAASWRRLEYAEAIPTFVKNEHCSHSH